MSAELVPSTPRGHALAIWSDEQKEIIRAAVAPGTTDAQLAHFAQVCQRRELDPFAGEIVGIVFGGKLSIVVTTEGWRSIAERSDLYAGQDAPEWSGSDGRWRDVWLEEKPPAAARVRVYRKDWEKPATGMARYASFVRLGRDGRPENLWRTMPDVMLAKCAEAQALKRAFPRQLADAGITVREDLSLAQRISMEGRELGLDDDGRHALVAEVTEGRTESSREVTPEEALAIRQRMAQLREEANTQPAYPVQTAADAWATQAALGAVMPSLKALEGDQIKVWRAWLHNEGIAQEAVRWTGRDVDRIALQLRAQGLWVEPEPEDEDVGEPDDDDGEEPF